MRQLLATLLLAALGAPVAAQTAAAPPATTAAGAQRPEHWAVPITLEGVPNLHRITPSSVPQRAADGRSA